MGINPTQRRHAASHHGVFTYETLRSLGSSPHQIDRLLTSGTLRAPVRGVYVLDGTPATYNQSLAIACAANPLAVISHRSTGRVLHLRNLGTVRSVELTVPKGHDLRFGAMTVHRSSHLPSEHIVTRPDGIRHTTLLRTIFDLCSVLDDDAIESIIEQAIDQFGVRVPQLFGLGTEMRRPGRNGTLRFVSVLASRPVFRKPAGSNHEVLLLQELRRLGLPEPECQAEIPVPDERTPLHPDFYWPEAQLAVEVDHVWWHGSREASRYDKRRDRKLARVGIQVSRVTEEDVEQQLTATAREIAEILEQRQRRAA